jgi:iron complex outermembrane recepter protein
LQAFQPEEAQTIEVGFKMDLLDATLRVNGAIFTSDYTDMQVTYRGPFRAPPAMSGVAPFITNAGKASIDGAELEVTWAPTLEFRLDASVGYLDATIDELDNLPLAIIPPGLVAGNALPFAPELKGNLGVQYAADAGNLVVTPRVDATYQDTTYFDAINTPEIAQLDSVTTLNASVSFATETGPWKVSLGVNNATDETYPIAGNSSLTTGSGYAEIAYSRPRQYFGYVQYEF